MGYEHIKVADVDLKVRYNWGSLNLQKYFHEGNEEAQATLDVNVGFTLDGFQPKPDYENGKMEIIVGDGDGAGINLYNIFRHIGYLAGNISQEYRFWHAAGLNLNGKGIIMVGNSENGKSTLASMLEGKVLDDDMLMVSQNQIKRITKWGMKMNIETGRLELIADDNDQSPLDYIFVLDNRHDPDHIVQIQSDEITPEITFDDKLHPSLLERYKERTPLAFKAKIFRLGTKRQPLETKKAIEKIISE